MSCKINKVVYLNEYYQEQFVSLNGKIENPANNDP